MTATIAQVITVGKSQTVRLPEEFRVSATEVYLAREDDRIILTPKTGAAPPEQLPATWDEFFATFSPSPEFDLGPRNDSPRKVELF